MRSLDKIQFYDHKLFYWLHHPKYRSLSIPVSKAFSFSGNGPLYAIIAIYIGLAHNFLFLKTLALAFGMERLAYFTLKPGLKRARPSQKLPYFSSVITPSDQFSFPSGHASAAFLFAWVAGEYFPLALFPLLVWAALVALSRVLLGVHFVTDIIAGTCLGSLFAFFAIAL